MMSTNVYYQDNVAMQLLKYSRKVHKTQVIMDHVKNTVQSHLPLAQVHFCHLLLQSGLSI